MKIEVVLCGLQWFPKTRVCSPIQKQNVPKMHFWKEKLYQNNAFLEMFRLFFRGTRTLIRFYMPFSLRHRVASKNLFLERGVQFQKNILFLNQDIFLNYLDFSICSQGLEKSKSLNS